jgi:hypothetical protein
VGLQLPQARGVHQLTGHAIRLAPLIDQLQARQLTLLGGHDHLSADLEWYVLGLAELLQGELAGAAVFCFERARPIVNPRVKHPRVVARLMRSERAFLVEDDESEIGASMQQLVGCGQTNDACSHDCHIRLGHVCRDSPVLRAPEHSLLSAALLAQSRPGHTSGPKARGARGLWLASCERRAQDGLQWPSVYWGKTGQYGD